MMHTFLKWPIVDFRKEVLTNFAVPIRANPDFQTFMELWNRSPKEGANDDISHPLPRMK